MNEYLITFRSVTAAQRAQALLRRHAIPAAVRRTPKALAQRGCGYSLAVGAGEEATVLLRGHGAAFGSVFRLLPDGTAGEVVV